MIEFCAIQWPDRSRPPVVVLAIFYNPPRRPLRSAPGGIRAASLDEAQTAQLVTLIRSIPTTEDRQ